MRKYLLPNADVLGYCLMPNHFHWLIVPKPRGIERGTAVKGVSRTAQIAGTSKVPAISATKQQRLTKILVHYCPVTLKPLTNDLIEVDLYSEVKPKLKMDG